MKKRKSIYLYLSITTAAMLLCCNGCSQGDPETDVAPTTNTSSSEYSETTAETTLDNTVKATTAKDTSTEATTTEAATTETAEETTNRIITKVFPEIVIEKYAKDTSYAKAYSELVTQYEDKFPDYDYTYDLIYFNNDSTPELVAGINGYCVTMYSYENGTMHTVIDDWPYGACGNAGYDYIPYQNVVRNYNGDFAGSIMYESYEKMNANFEIESYYEGILNIWYAKDLDGNGIPDYSEEAQGTFYYLGHTEITKEQYNSYVIEGDYKELKGAYSADELLKILQPQHK